jgi:hypothetical protein
VPSFKEGEDRICLAGTQNYSSADLGQSSCMELVRRAAKKGKILADEKLNGGEGIL